MYYSALRTPKLSFNFLLALRRLLMLRVWHVVFTKSTPSRSQCGFYFILFVFLFLPVAYKIPSKRQTKNQKERADRTTWHIYTYAQRGSRWHHLPGAVHETFIRAWIRNCIEFLNLKSSHVIDSKFTFKILKFTSESWILRKRFESYIWEIAIELQFHLAWSSEWGICVCTWVDSFSRGLQQSVS